MKDETNNSPYSENEVYYQYEHEREQLLNQLKSFLSSFEESNHLFDQLANKFIALENELLDIIKEKQINEQKMKEENDILKLKYDRLLEKNITLRKAKELETNELIQKMNDIILNHKNNCVNNNGIETPREEEDLFFFYQNNLNEANEKITQLSLIIQETKIKESEFKKKDAYIIKSLSKIDFLKNENKLLNEKLFLNQKEISILEANANLLKEEIIEVSKSIV